MVENQCLTIKADLCLIQSNSGTSECAFLYSINAFLKGCYKPEIFKQNHIRTQALWNLPISCIHSLGPTGSWKSLGNYVINERMNQWGMSKVVLYIGKILNRLLSCHSVREFVNQFSIKGRAMFWLCGCINHNFHFVCLKWMWNEKEFSSNRDIIKNMFMGKKEKKIVVSFKLLYKPRTAVENSVTIFGPWFSQSGWEAVVFRKQCRGLNLQSQVLCRRTYSNYGFRLLGVEKIALLECVHCFGSEMLLSGLLLARGFW